MVRDEIALAIHALKKHCYRTSVRCRFAADSCLPDHLAGENIYFRYMEGYKPKWFIYAETKQELETYIENVREFDDSWEFEEILGPGSEDYE